MFTFAYQIAVVISPVFFIILIVKLNHLILLTIKNHNTTMATLADFQAQADEIKTATDNISAYVTGAGMSAADQDTALNTVRDAVTNLKNAIPTPPATGG